MKPSVKVSNEYSVCLFRALKINVLLLGLAFLFKIVFYPSPAMTIIVIAYTLMMLLNVSVMIANFWHFEKNPIINYLIGFGILTTLFILVVFGTDTMMLSVLEFPKVHKQINMIAATYLISLPALLLASVILGIWFGKRKINLINDALDQVNASTKDFTGDMYIGNHMVATFISGRFQHIRN